MDDRRAMTAIFYVLPRASCGKRFPERWGRQYGARSLSILAGARRVPTIVEAGLQAYDEVQRIEWTWHAVDGP